MTGAAGANQYCVRHVGAAMTRDASSIMASENQLWNVGKKKSTFI